MISKALLVREFPTATALADFTLEVHPGTTVVLELKGRALEGSGDLAGLGGNRSMQGQGGAIEPGVKSEKRALG